MDKTNTAREDTQETIDDVWDLGEDNGFSRSYIEKSKIISQAINDIGYGRYQNGLFIAAGFGWFADNAWPIVTSLILPRVALEFNWSTPYLLTLSQNLGLLAGALVWSLSSDIVGRKWAFNLTFLITGIFATISGSSPTFAAICCYSALWSFGVGGNLPIDTAVFLEVLPQNKQYLLTIMSVWWALGQVVVTLVAWGLIGTYSCEGPTCDPADNKGWRYLLYTMGGLTLIMFGVRFAIRLFESPKFLLAKGLDSHAVDTVNRIASINGKPDALSMEDLGEFVEEEPTLLLQERFKKYGFSHIKACFGSRKLAISSTLVILAWAIIGLAFPLYNAFLPYYLQTRGNANEPTSVHTAYRNTLIIAVVGVPGSILSGFLVDLKHLGRKGTLCVLLILTGVFLFASTTAKSSNQLLGWNCAFNFCSNSMYGVLYAYTPEVFPSKIRGTAMGLASSANRILGVMSPIIANFSDLTTSAPIFVSGALFIASGLLVLFFPYEPRGRSSL